MEDANNEDLAGTGAVIDHVAADREFSIAWLDVITASAELRIVGQPMKGIVELGQVSVSLLDAPPLLREPGNLHQIIFGCVGKLKAGHNSMGNVVQFVNELLQGVVGDPAFFTFFQQHS